MPMDTNEGFMMRCKTITANLLTVLVLLVELSTSVAHPKGSLEEYLVIGKPP